MNEPVDEICGYLEEPDYNSVFDSSSGSLNKGQKCIDTSKQSNKLTLLLN